MGVKRWDVKLAAYVKEQLQLISDRRIQKVLRGRLRRLEYEPEKQGKPLAEDLEGYRSIRAVGQRYRIIYKIEEERVVVLIVMVGIRKKGDKKDVYTQAIRLARLGLLDLE